MPATRPTLSPAAGSTTSLPANLGELRASDQFSETRLKHRSVKDELRENLICRLKTKGSIFPGS